VGQVIELLDESAFRDLDREERCGVIHKGGTAVYWNSIAWRRPDGEFAFDHDHPELEGGSDGQQEGGGDAHDWHLHTFDRVAALTDRSVGAVEDEFHRKHRYVEYFVSEGIDDFGTLYDLLADLETDEAATVERLTRQATDPEEKRGAGDD